MYASVVRGGVFGRGVWCLLLCGLLATPALAAPPELPVPPALAPYVDWVKTRNPDRLCPVVDGAAACMWPGALSLELDDSGGRFEQRVYTDRAGYVALPGSERHWPQDVRLGAGAAVVLSRGGLPAVRVPAGDHVIAGSLHWAHQPEVLAIPEATAMVSLTLSGKPVAFPRRDGATLWLSSAGRTEAGEGERTTLRVHRRIDDGVPMVVTTRIHIRAAGRARELLLGNVLLPGTTPIAIDADLPARLDADGKLSAQVRAGEFTLELLARYDASPERIAAPKLPGPWPAQEVWVFDDSELARQVVVDGVPGIDPARTELPEAWRSLPAYLLAPGDALSLQTRRRGQPEPPPNQLHLSRTLWLDLDGQGFTGRDEMHGQLEQGFRLDLREGQLGRVSSHGNDLLITRAEDGEVSGVELREEALSMTAEWRGTGSLGDLAAVGWSEDVSSLQAVLHLPPGYELLSASGVDEVDTWLGRWDLLDFLLVLLVAIAVGKLLGPVAGGLALSTTVLCAHESDAPQGVWLAVVACVALLRIVKPGRGRKLLSVVSGVVLLSWAGVVLPFATDQLRQALFPQLARSFHSTTFSSGGFDAPEMDGFIQEEAPMPAATEARPAAPPEPEMDAMMAREEAMQHKRSRTPVRAGKRSGGVGGRGYGLKGSSAGEWAAGDFAQDPAAVVQTGPGVPNWRFQQVHLGWSGPVEKGHRIGLWLLTPTVNRVLSVLRVALVLLLALWLLRASRQAYGGPPVGASGGGATAAAVATSFALVLLGGAGYAQAQTPDPQLLEELEQRLSEPAQCLPDCLDVASAQLRVDGGGLTYVAEVHVGDATSLKLPGPAKDWVPSLVKLGGFASHALMVRDDGFIHLRLPAGRHTVEVRGAMPASDTVTLALGDVPRTLQVNAQGYDVGGLREDGRPTGNLVLARLLPSGEQGAKDERSTLPPFTELSRTFVIGTTWQVRSQLTRRSPVGSPVVVHLPLLPGESVTDAAVEVRNGEVHVSLGRDDTEVSWTSTLQSRGSLPLTAVQGQGVSERWVLQCGPVWHCTPEGLPPVRHTRGGHWAPEFWPWPGESLALSFRRPEAAEGSSTTIDDAQLSLRPGVRLLEAQLDVTLRSSVGGVHTLSLPESAKVQALIVNGAERSVRAQQGQVGVQIAPGRSQIELRFQEPGGLQVLQQSPTVDLGARVANARVQIDVPDDRVVLWAFGPSWGPAVLFWGYLALVVLMAIGLSRIPRSPMRLWQWLLLGLGLSQAPLPVWLAVVGWFFVMERRGRVWPGGPRMHNLVQVGLMLWTFVAAGCLYGAVYDGLLMRPDMQVSGAGSSNGSLRWIGADIVGALPRPSMVSVPLWAWKVAMLLWALWLASSLVRWVPWAWGCFSMGERFRSMRVEQPEPKPVAPAAAPKPGPDATDG